MKNFLFALRYLRKLRGGTLARVVSLSLGLAVGLLVFSYANYNLTSDRKSTRLNSSHREKSRMPSSA